MGLNDTVSADRVHIGFFGMRNAGKSSVVNAVTGQNLSIVSDVKGTTTDPVRKAMELLPLGPVVIIDTPGLDDSGELGSMRVKKAKEVLARTDIAVMIVDSTVGLKEPDNELIDAFKERKLPYIISYNKADLLENRKEPGRNEIYVSAATKENIYELKELIAELAKGIKNEKRLIADILSPGDMTVLVIPIDESAPKGRLILPQEQVMRDILDANCAFVTCQDTELKSTLDALAVKPRIVVTDSQVFENVARDTPEDIPLTSFSILFARYKGDLAEQIRGASALMNLKDGDRILMAEGCTHHRQCYDIAAYKFPRWIEKYSGAKAEFSFSSGTEFTDEPEKYDLIIHCGGCMLNEKEMKNRIRTARNAGVPIINYGTAIAAMHGVLKRCVSMFPDMAGLLP